MATDPDEQMTTDRGVRVGVSLSPDLLRLERAQLVDLVDQINGSAVDHVGVTDHVSFRGGRGSDGLAAMHYLAGLGVDRELHTGVLILPIRHPTLVARQLLDLADVHEPGVVAGVGVGGDDPEEYMMVGMSAGERGARMDDALSVLHELLADQQHVENGGFYPTKGPGIERGSGLPVKVLVGGRVDASHQRAARADGWLAAFSSTARFAAGAQRVREFSPSAILGYQAWFGVGSGGRTHAEEQIRRFYGLDPTAFERYVPVGNSDDLIEHFAPYAEAGSNLLTLTPAGDPQQGIEEISTFAKSMHGAS